MAHNFQTWLIAPVIELQSIDSTNNYAMQLIDADKAQHGMTITAKEQTAGKGQRGHQWQSASNQNLLMSIIYTPKIPIEKQFLFSAAIAFSVSKTLNCLNNDNNLFSIKWPNDLIINDRKAGGILIENVIRGRSWMYSVIGIGINVLQNNFPEHLPFATSLKKELKLELNVPDIGVAIRYEIMNCMSHHLESTFQFYNELLYKKNQVHYFSLKGEIFKAIVINVLENGQLILEMEDGSNHSFNHGEIEWVWK